MSDYINLRPRTVEPNAALETLRFIEKYIEDHGFAPTTRELCVFVGGCSTDTMHRRLMFLRDRGFLTWMPRQTRTMRVIKSSDEW